MRFLRSTWKKRFIVASLIASLLPLMASPFLDQAKDASVDHYADWVRKQLGSDVSALVEQAIDTARASDAHNLAHFLEAFIGAYTEAAQLNDAVSFSDTAFFSLLHSHYLQLVGKSVVPSLILKSLTARSSASSERSGSDWIVFSGSVLDIEPDGWMIGKLSYGGAKLFQLFTHSIHPRGP